MNCEVAHERIVLAVWGELADDQVHELERHLAICPECGREREQVKALRTLASAHTVLEPDANLVARAHIRLDDALDALPAKNWLERLLGHVTSGMNGLRTAPMAAACLLVAGVAGGALGGYQVASHRAPAMLDKPVHALAQPEAAQPQAASGTQSAGTAAEMERVANISSVIPVPNSRFVDVRYSQMIPQQIRGSLDDPSMQRLLSQASLRAASVGARDSSVGLLASECRAGRGCSDPSVRNALLMALRYDQDEEVRAKALEGLEPLVAEDTQVRNAILKTLMNDDDPRIRTVSIKVLRPVEGDTSVREVLYTISTQDENPQIRDVSRQVLNRLPEIQ